MAMSLSLVVVILYWSISGTTITSVEWLINGTRLEDFSLTNVETQFIELFRQGSLVFSNISVEYNNTNIQCRATLSNGETNSATLLVQGERERDRYMKMDEDGAKRWMNPHMVWWTIEFTETYTLRLNMLLIWMTDGNPIPHPYINSPGMSSL